MDYKHSASIEYASEEAATMVMNTLSVDEELNEGKVSRVLRVEDKTLHISFEATEARLLRAAVSAFYDLLGLATRALEEFGPK
mmetsp:Transcript_32/g.77  ORF Transcript_32/g.77 Transcript_32/m.77 type:complete len:83 (+) Transcript_32:127-375(+)|eukprot:CAMPEP_0118931774 /NCGR_PEP_ID=MMETSP1169-20130426/7999_1 /TAXON_ID=36882 /ORGANISM="Pyramimonas obovata, Strain CCMP722" /LENGTH=82 /DNA_ID=CAMNT_0006874313 /DNA_START=100 /DNA_END=348 /DNA_ORIENTATION=-